MKPAGKRLLVVAPNWLGDSVMAGPAVAALGSPRLGGHVSVLARPSLIELWKGFPGVDDAIPLEKGRGPFGRLSAMSRMARALRARNFDRALILPPSFSSARCRYGRPRIPSHASRGERRAALAACGRGIPGPGPPGLRGASAIRAGAPVGGSRPGRRAPLQVPLGGFGHPFPQRFHRPGARGDLWSRQAMASRALAGSHRRTSVGAPGNPAFGGRRGGGPVPGTPGPRNKPRRRSHPFPGGKDTDRSAGATPARLAHLHHQRHGSHASGGGRGHPGRGPLRIDFPAVEAALGPGPPGPPPSRPVQSLFPETVQHRLSLPSGIDAGPRLSGSDGSSSEKGTGRWGTVVARAGCWIPEGAFLSGSRFRRITGRRFSGPEDE